MTKLPAYLIVAILIPSLGCKGNQAPSQEAPAKPAAAEPQAPPKAEMPPLDPNNIVSIAIASKDHSTLVAALKAADYVAAIANPGPLTVFAPTNAAFEKLPAGTVENLLKPENVDQLKNVLKYHATTSVHEAKDFKDGEVLAMANGAKVTIHVKDGKVMVNDANVVGSARASNGIVHVIDGVLLPPAN